jgi:Flp pilus assembly protein TadG
MRKLLHCRRGTAAFATVIALVPLIGAVSLGAEAGSWYVTKQHAQNAADAAAFSGALRVACSISGSSSCDTAHDYVFRGKQFAAQNSFCNSGDSSYPGAMCTVVSTDVSQSVTIDRGNWTAGTWTSSATGSYVRAVVQQSQPAYLAAVLGLSAVDIGAQAIAHAGQVKQVCGLGLGPSANALWLGGSVNLAGNGCGLQSDNTVKLSSTPTVTGSGWEIYGVTGCTGSSGECTSPGLPYNYYMPPAVNPLSKLDNEAFNSAITTGNNRACPPSFSSCTIVPNTSPTAAYTRNLTVTNGNTVTFQSGGTYFFYNASITINGGTVTGSNINIVLLGNSSLSITGGNVTLSANTNNTTYPDLNGVLFDDQAPGTPASNNVTVNGGGTVELDGASYFPNVSVSWSGTTSATNSTCSEVIANTLTITGNTYMSTNNCVSGTIPYTQVVALVQ